MIISSFTNDTLPIVTSSDEGKVLIVKNGKWSVGENLPPGGFALGGKICCDLGATANTYSFLTAAGNEITDWSLSSLQNAVYAVKIGDNPSYRFYVWAENYGQNNIGWGVWRQTYGSSDGIGKGIVNTTKALASSALTWPDASPFGIARYCRTNSIYGQTNWFVPTKAEHDVIIAGGVVGFYSGKYTWSSCEYNNEQVWAYNSGWGARSTGYTGASFPVYAF